MRALSLRASASTRWIGVAGLGGIGSGLSSQFGEVLELGISSAKFDFLLRFRIVLSCLVSSSELTLSSGVFGWPLAG